MQSAPPVYRRCTLIMHGRQSVLVFPGSGPCYQAIGATIEHLQRCRHWVPSGERSPILPSVQRWWPFAAMGCAVSSMAQVRIDTDSSSGEPRTSGKFRAEAPYPPCVLVRQLDSKQQEAAQQRLLHQQRQAGQPSRQRRRRPLQLYCHRSATASSFLLNRILHLFHRAADGSGPAVSSKKWRHRQGAGAAEGGRCS